MPGIFEGSNLLIGPGSVGQAYAELTNPHIADTHPHTFVYTDLQPDLLMGSDHIIKTIEEDGSTREVMEWADLSMSSLSRLRSFATAIDSGAGGDEYRFTSALLKAGVPGVTAAKGMMRVPKYRTDLSKHAGFKHFNFDPTVGGNTPVLETVRHHFDHSQPGQRDLVMNNPNGTWAFVLSEIANGADYKEAIASATEAGFTEPGATDPIEIMKAELGDAASKLAIMTMAAYPRSDDVQCDFEEFLPRGTNVMTDDQILYVLKTGGYAMLNMIVTDGRGTALAEHFLNPSAEEVFNGVAMSVGWSREHRGPDVVFSGIVDLAWLKESLPEASAFQNLDRGPTSKVVTVRDVAGSTVVNSVANQGAGPIPTAMAMARGLRSVLPREA